MDENNKFDLAFKELHQAVKEIEPYYDVDKIKSYSVYIWSKPNDEYSDDADDWGKNVFDICEDEIIYYVEDHVISDEVMTIIRKIQEKLQKVRLSLGSSSEC